MRRLILGLAAALAWAGPPAALAQPAPSAQAVKSWLSKTSGSATSAATLFTAATNDPQTVYWSFSSAGSGNSVSAEVSFDNGATWLAILSAKTNSPASGAATSFAIATADVYQADIGPGNMFRLRVSTYGSGTVTVNANFRPFVGALTSVITTPSGSGSQIVVGNVASGATDSGAPVKVGLVFNTTPPTVTTGQRIDAQATNRGEILVAPSSGGTAQTFSSVPVNGVSNSANLAQVLAKNYVVNSSGSWDQQLQALNTLNSVGTGIVAAGHVALCDDTSPTLISENSQGVARMDCVTHAAIVRPYASQAQAWNYAAATAGISNTTTAVTIKTAAGAGIRNCFTGLQLASDALGAATEFAVRDGAAGPVLWRTKIGTAGIVNGIAIPLETPICGTANTLLEVITLTASITGSVFVNSQGYASP